MSWAQLNASNAFWVLEPIAVGFIQVPMQFRSRQGQNDSIWKRKTVSYCSLRTEYYGGRLDNLANGLATDNFARIGGPVFP